MDILAQNNFMLPLLFSTVLLVPFLVYHVTLLIDDEVIRQKNLKFLPRMQLINFLFGEPEKNIGGTKLVEIK